MNIRRAFSFIIILSLLLTTTCADADAEYSYLYSNAAGKIYLVETDDGWSFMFFEGDGRMYCQKYEGANSEITLSTEVDGHAVSITSMTLPYGQIERINIPDAFDSVTEELIGDVYYLKQGCVIAIHNVDAYISLPSGICESLGIGIAGYAGSTAQAFAESHGLPFELLDGNISSGTPYITVDAGLDNGLSAVATGGRGMDVNVKSNTEWFIRIVDGQDWISVSCDSGYGNGSFYTLIAENTNGFAREGWIEVSAYECESIYIRVTQEDEYVQSSSGGIADISVGDAGTVVLYSDGTVGTAGQWLCFNGGGYTSSECTNVTSIASTWKDVVYVVSNRNTILAIHADGTVSYVANDACEYVMDDYEWNDIVQIDASSTYNDDVISHVVGVTSTGSVIASGDNQYGQCEVDHWPTDIIQVATGYGHTVGLRSNGTVVTTGDWHVCTEVFDDWTDIVQIEACNGLTLGLKNDGTVRAANYGDDCEDGDMHDYMNWSGSPIGSWTDIIQIDVGENMAVGLRADGTVLSYYGNVYGCDADGNEIHVSDAYDVSDWTDIAKVAVGNAAVVGIRNDGSIVARAFEGREKDIIALGSAVPNKSADQALTSYEVLLEGDPAVLASLHDMSQYTIVFDRGYDNTYSYYVVDGIPLKGNMGLYGEGKKFYGQKDANGNYMSAVWIHSDYEYIANFSEERSFLDSIFPIRKATTINQDYIVNGEKRKLAFSHILYL